MLRYIICTTARSGSNLLCDYLKNTQIAGCPAEFLNPDVIRRGAYGKRFEYIDEFSTEKYLTWLTANQLSPNDVFGMKILFEDFEHFIGFPAFQELFHSSKILFLRRRNKIKQALSYYFAEATGQWVASDAARMPTADVPYSFTAIQQHLARIANQEARWLVNFNSLGQEYSELFFEDFTHSPETQLTRALKDIGVDATSFPLRANLVAQKIQEAGPMHDRFLLEAGEQIQRPVPQRPYKGMTLFP
jgi:LPS sulfotransferase NodH